MSGIDRPDEIMKNSQGEGQNLNSYVPHHNVNTHFMCNVGNVAKFRENRMTLLDFRKSVTRSLKNVIGAICSPNTCPSL